MTLLIYSHKSSRSLFTIDISTNNMMGKIGPSLLFNDHQGIRSQGLDKEGTERWRFWILIELNLGNGTLFDRNRFLYS